MGWIQFKNMDNDWEYIMKPEDGQDESLIPTKRENEDILVRYLLRCSMCNEMMETDIETFATREIQWNCNKCHAQNYNKILDEQPEQEA